MPFKSDKQRKFLFKEKPEVAKKFVEHSESSAASGALFKENLPRKTVVADIWQNLNAKPPQSGRQLEAAEDDTLMGRLAKRMASRDMIDELNLGPKGRTGKVKAAQVADNFNEVPSKMMIGPGLHEQMHDKKSVNMSDPIPNKLNISGSTMKDQAKVISKNPIPRDWKPVAIADNELKMGIEIEKEHTDKEEIAKKIAQDHLKEMPDYYSRLKKMEKAGKK